MKDRRRARERSVKDGKCTRLECKCTCICRGFTGRKEGKKEGRKEGRKEARREGTPPSKAPFVGSSSLELELEVESVVDSRWEPLELLPDPSPDSSALASHEAMSGSHVFILHSHLSGSPCFRIRLGMRRHTSHKSHCTQSSCLPGSSPFLFFLPVFALPSKNKQGNFISPGCCRMLPCVLMLPRTICIVDRTRSVKKCQSSKKRGQ